jgi:replication initiation protein RepC
VSGFLLPFERRETMQIGSVTTPFGRRPAKLALVRQQMDITPPARSADKWKIFRDICEARDLLGVPDRALTVLNALLSFYPETELQHDGQLIVFPSNNQLAARAHGIAGATLRRHLAALVEAGIVVRQDSPNGKRYARKDRAGDIETAFGFDLTPLLARADEFAMLAQQIVADRAAHRRLKEALTICRRDIRKLITAAMEEGADGDWATIEGMYIGQVSRIPRSPTSENLREILEDMQMLRSEILNILEMQLKSEKTSANDDHFERHIQNSNPDSIDDLEPRSEKEQGAKPELKSFPLGMVLKACPEIVMYGKGGEIGSWRELMAAAVVVRSMLGVSPSAYQQACEVMGPENAAAVMASILERGGHINSAGGYLRSLTERARKGEFSLGPMLMALLRANGMELPRTG